MGFLEEEDGRRVVLEKGDQLVKSLRGLQAGHVPRDEVHQLDFTSTNFRVES